jgi:hypothetical protein
MSEEDKPEVFFWKLSTTAQLTRKRNVSQKASVVNDLEELP